MFFCLFTCLFKVMNAWQSFIFLYWCHGMTTELYFWVVSIRQIHPFGCLPLLVSAFMENTKVGQVELLLIACLPFNLLPASSALCQDCTASHYQHQLLLNLALVKASSRVCQTSHLNDMNGCGFLPVQQHSWPPENASFLFSWGRCEE